MKTLISSMVMVLSAGTIVYGWGLDGSCSSKYQEVTLAEQTNRIKAVLVVRIDGMELHQLTNKEGKVLFSIRNIFGEELAKDLDLKQLANQFPTMHKALLES